MGIYRNEMNEFIDKTRLQSGDRCRIEEPIKDISADESKFGKKQYQAPVFFERIETIALCGFNKTTLNACIKAWGRWDGDLLITDHWVGKWFTVEVRSQRVRNEDRLVLYGTPTVTTSPPNKTAPPKATAIPPDAQTTDSNLDGILRQLISTESGVFTTGVPFQVILKKMQQNGEYTTETIRDSLKRLMTQGHMFEPRPDCFLAI